MTHRDYSIKNGDSIQVGNTYYKGRNPVYDMVENPKTGIKEWTKIRPGVPWVKISEDK